MRKILSCEFNLDTACVELKDMPFIWHVLVLFYLLQSKYSVNHCKP